GSNNPFFKSKYADLNAILEATEPILLKHELIVLQPVINGFVCTQIIDIATGDKVESVLQLPEIADPQKLIASITYYRRGSLQSLLSLQAVDDDGNTAREGVKETKPSIAMD
ncbi:MAG: ERF family protein, partial [bacterium]